VRALTTALVDSSASGFKRMGLQRVVEKLERSAAEYLVLDSGEEGALRKRWREIFAKPRFVTTGEWVREDFEWHNFSDGLTPALEGANAIEAYTALPAGAVWVLSDGYGWDRFAVRATFDRTPLPTLECPGADVLVVDVDFQWTMAFTHEDGWYGPYFATAAAAVEAAQRLTKHLHQNV
jgi:hypothetical protein